MSITVGARARNKVFAILAAGLVVGVGATMTAASWSDQEWVFAGSGTAPGIGTSTFDVQQSTSTTTPLTWVDRETEPTANGIVFAPDALSMTPGASVYAGVALSTSAASTVGGNLTLQPAIPSTIATGTPAPDDAAGPLWTALTLDVRSVSIPQPSAVVPVCNATTFATTYDTAVITAQPGQTGLSIGTASAAQRVEPGRTNIEYYCFKVTLPSPQTNALQTHTVAPAWKFSAESD